MGIVKRSALYAMALLGLLATAPLAWGADDAATIRAGTESWLKAHNASNADAIAAMYAEDAVVMPPGAPVARGRAAIKQFLVKQEVLPKCLARRQAMTGNHFPKWRQ